MPITQLSLAVVGADYPNRRGPGRRFEIRLCAPGEPVELRREPSNLADSRAVAVFSCRGVQIGYLTAERCGWIGSMMEQGREVAAIFQRASSFGAYIRVGLDGVAPSIPDEPPEPGSTDDSGFWPDYLPPDD